MYFGATCGARRRRSADRNSEWKSSQWAACSKYGFMPGNGDGMVHLLGALSDEEPCAFLPASARLEDNTKGLPKTKGTRARSGRGTFPTWGPGVSRSANSRSPARTTPGTDIRSGPWARKGPRIERVRKADRQRASFSEWKRWD